MFRELTPALDHFLILLERFRTVRDRFPACQELRAELATQDLAKHCFSA